MTGRPHDAPDQETDRRRAGEPDRARRAPGDRPPRSPRPAAKRPSPSPGPPRARRPRRSASPRPDRSSLRAGSPAPEPRLSRGTGRRRPGSGRARPSGAATSRYPARTSDEPERPRPPARPIRRRPRGGRRRGRYDGRLARAPASASAKSAAVGKRSAGHLGERPHHAPLHAFRHRGAHGPERRHRIHRVARQQLLGGGPDERRLAREHLVQHAAERVQVAPSVQLPAGGGLLRAHVRGRAEGEAGLGEPVLSPAAVMARATPKSATTASSPSSRMFSGLMSRWMTPWAWA